MLKRKKIFSVLLIFFSCLPFFSQEDAKIILTVEDAVKSALENNLDIKTSYNSLELLKKKKDYSWGNVSPSVTLSASSQSDLENNSSSFSVSGGVRLSIMPNLYHLIQSAVLSYEKGLITYDQKCKSIELNVRKAFYGLLYSAENIRLQKRNLETSLSQYEQNQNKFINGQISELDVLTSKVNYEQQKPSLESAIVSYESDLANFKQIIGINQNKNIELSGSLDEVKFDVDFNFSDESSPDIKNAEKSLEIAKNSLTSNRFSSYIPSVSASYNLGKSYNDISNKWNTNNNVSVSVSLPLDGYLPWTQSGLNIKTTKNQVEEAKINLEKTVMSVSIEKQNCLRSINQGINQLDSLKSNVELAEKTYNMTKTAYDYGKTDLLSLQTASDKVLKASLSLKSQYYSLICKIYDLEYLMGLSLGSLVK